MAEISDWLFDGSFDVPEVPEPSGMCYYPPHDSLFIVDDGGRDRPASLAELDLNCKVLQQQPLGVDLEGVCYCSGDGMLYVSDEDSERVYVVDPNGLKKLRQFTISREFEGAPLLKAGGNGIEGIEFIPGATDGDSYFLLLNQDDPRGLVRVPYLAAHGADNDAVVALDWWMPLPDINAGELYYLAALEELWVVHSWMNLLEVLDIHSMQVKRWEVLPGCAQEALALDGQGRLWIGSDTGGVIRYVRPQEDYQTGVK
jgi:hypothetical protein